MRIPLKKKSRKSEFSYSFRFVSENYESDIIDVFFTQACDFTDSTIENTIDDEDGDGIDNDDDAVPYFACLGDERDIDSDGDFIADDGWTPSPNPACTEQLKQLRHLDPDSLLDSDNTINLDYLEESGYITMTPDPDDDNDGVNDVDDDGTTPLDICPQGQTGWTSYTKAQVDEDAEDDITDITDNDGDGCRDNDDPSTADINEGEDLDDDGDGLIEIHNLTMLYNMRYDLDGSHYNDNSTESNAGCPTPDGCNGYELVVNLDFDRDGDGTFIEGSPDDCDVIGDNPATDDIIETTHPRTDDDLLGCTMDMDDTIDTDGNPLIYFSADDGDDTNGINEGWVPIGDCGTNGICGTNDNNFSATFNGNGHTISNLYSKRTDKISLGLFGSVSSAAVIQNIGLEAGLIISSSSSSYAGGLVGYNESTITNSYATGDVSSSSSYAGGLVGYNESTITNSYATGDVSSSSSESYAGGLVGYNESTITNSYATGGVSSSSSSARSYTGGLMGYNEGSITNSYATGGVSSSSSSARSYAGGLVGVNQGAATITNSYATSGVSSSSSSSESYAGGLVGVNQSGATITNNYATGDVSSSSSSSSYAGGFVGVNQGGATITNSYATGDVSSSSSSSYAGGLVGVNSGATITNSYNNSEATITSTENDSSGTINTDGDARTLNQLRCPTMVGETCGVPDEASSYTAWNPDPTTQTECDARNGTWDTTDSSCADANAIWNFGTTLQFPGLCIGGKRHRPIHSPRSGFSVLPFGTCP